MFFSNLPLPPGSSGSSPTESALVPLRYRVRRYKTETSDTFTLWLQSETDEPCLRFLPGQFNMLYAHPIGDAPISVSGSPEREGVLVHTIRAVGPVTRALARLKKGDPILLRGPFGTPWPVEAARGHDVVIVAGGIGLAPLRPVLYHIAAHRADFGKVCLLYGARTPQDVLYPTELALWGNKRQMQVAVTVDRGDETWRGDVGVVTRLLDRAVFDPKQTVAMVCGPEIMMHFGRLALEKRGVAAEQMYLSMERNMKCGVGTCGHCQLGPFFLCKDGPVLPFSALRPYFSVREL